MAIATVKDLCMDVSDPGIVGPFWAELLGLDLELMADGDAVLRQDGAAVIWVNRVPEEKVVKNRVHLDVWVTDVDELASLGATEEDDQDGFSVWADPEGNELCAFPVPDGVVLDSPGRWFALCTDSARPAEAAAWWAGVVGGELRPGPDDDLRYLHGAAGLGDVTWKFVPVDDERQVKNRWHWDVTAEVGDLVAAGATVLAGQPEGLGWTVLVDPDGNEFCAFAPKA